MSHPRLLACLLVAFVVGSVGQSQVAAQRSRTERKPAVELYVVVDVDGELSVMTKTDQIALLKKSVADYRESVKNYATARKEAAQKKEKFSEPRPVAKKVKVMGKTYKTQELAEAYMQKLQESREKLKERHANSRQ